MLGEGGHHHVEMNVDRLNIETTPVIVSRRKIKAGLQGMKEEERKKVTVGLLCLIGGGMTVGLITIIWAIRPATKTEETKDSTAAVAQAVDSGKKTEKPAVEKTTTAEQEPKYGNKANVDKFVAGSVEVMVLEARRGEPPKGAKTDQTYVLVVQVKLNLKAGETSPSRLRVGRVTASRRRSCSRTTRRSPMRCSTRLSRAATTRRSRKTGPLWISFSRPQPARR